jgi:hypothetical protein
VKECGENVILSSRLLNNGDQVVTLDSLKRALAEILPGPEYFTELLEVMKDIRGQKVRPLQDEIERIKTPRETGGTAHAHQPNEKRTTVDKGDKDDKDFAEYYYTQCWRRDTAHNAYLFT